MCDAVFDTRERDVFLVAFLVGVHLDEIFFHGVNKPQDEVDHDFEIIHPRCHRFYQCDAVDMPVGVVGHHDKRFALELLQHFTVDDRAFQSHLVQQVGCEFHAGQMFGLVINPARAVQSGELPGPFDVFGTVFFPENRMKLFYVFVTNQYLFHFI